MFESIVVPLDGSTQAEVALHPALTIASQTGATIVLLSVAQTNFVDERRDYLRGWARSAFLPCEIDIEVEGFVPSRIIAAAAKHAPALVCLASHGRGALGRAVFGTNSAEVIRKIGAPVLAVGPHGPSVDAYTEVLAAVDASRESAAILPAAVDLARVLDAKLQIVQVIDPDDLRRVSDDVVPGDVLEVGNVATLASQVHEDVTVGWDVLHNDKPADGLVDYARAYPAAIVAMTTHARSGFSLLAEGSVANHVVHSGANPVLLLH